MRRLLLALCSVLTFLSVFSQSPGTPDPTFGSGGSTYPLSSNPRFSEMVVQPDGKIVAAGFVEQQGGYNILVARYNYDGSLDKTLNGGVVIEKIIGHPILGFALAVQPDGKILIAGFVSTNGNSDFGIARYTKNGKLDSSFGINGRVTTDIGYYVNGTYYSTEENVTSIAVEASGKILAVGKVYQDSGENSGGLTGALVRYNTNGTVDSKQRFYTEFSSTDDNYPQVSAYHDGGYVISSNRSSTSNYLYSTRFGERIITTAEHEEFNTPYQKHHILSNGKIAFLHLGNYYPGSLSHVTLFNADGSKDNGFSEDGYLEFDYDALSITSEKNGKIIISGSPEDAPTITTRYNQDGTVDGTFGVNGKIDLGSSTIASYGNRLYVAGQALSAFILNIGARHLKVNLHGNTDPYNHGEWN
ncbi:MAG TPA: hypothetical protein VGB56_10440, partial [Flavisolibacter sp.]